MRRNSHYLWSTQIICSSVAASLVGLSSAAVNYSEVLTPAFETAQIDEFETTGSEMAGMIFTVNYADSTSASAPWASVALDSGSATSAGNFLLSLTGTTFSNPWSLTNDYTSAIVGFSFSGLEGSTIFDRTTPDPGTAGSSLGRDFAFEAAFSDWDADVVYTGPIELAGSPGAVGDLFVSLDVTLTDETVAPQQTIEFLQDTDTASIGINEIPEPSSGIALGLLLSSGFMLRRRA